MMKYRARSDTYYGLNIAKLAWIVLAQPKRIRLQMISFQVEATVQFLQYLNTKMIFTYRCCSVGVDQKMSEAWVCLVQHTDHHYPGCTATACHPQHHQPGPGTPRVEDSEHSHQGHDEPDHWHIHSVADHPWCATENPENIWWSFQKIIEMKCEKIFQLWEGKNILSLTWLLTEALLPEPPSELCSQYPGPPVFGICWL